MGGNELNTCLKRKTNRIKMDCNKTLILWLISVHTLGNLKTRPGETGLPTQSVYTNSASRILLLRPHPPRRTGQAKGSSDGVGGLLHNELAAQLWRLIGVQ